jgi:hypothetical protein
LVAAGARDVHVNRAAVTGSGARASRVRAAASLQNSHGLVRAADTAAGREPEKEKRRETEIHPPKSNPRQVALPGMNA